MPFGAKLKVPLVDGETFVERRNRLGRLRYKEKQAEKKDIAAGLIPDKSKGMTKGAAIGVLEFLKGDLYRASLVTGIEVRVLNIWREDFGTQKVLEGIRDADPTTDVLKNYLECLAVFGLMKAAKAELSDINTAMEVVHKLITKLGPAKHAEPVPLPISVPVAPDAVPEMSVPSPVVTHSAKSQWELLVSQIVADSEKTNSPVTRDQAIESVIAKRPEAAAYLSPAPTEVEQAEDVQEYEN